MVTNGEEESERSLESEMLAELEATLDCDDEDEGEGELRSVGV